MTVRSAVLSLLFSVSVWAICSPVAQAQAPAQTRIVANVELVQVPVIIFDDKGAVATSLKKSDFRLVDDGVEQRILYFERERLPVSFVVLADLSSSMTKKIPFVQEAAVSLLDPLEEPQQDSDEYSVLSIGKRCSQLLSFSRDQQDLEHKLPLLLTATNESTALFAVMAGPSFELPTIFLPHEKKRNRSQTGAGSHPQLPDFLASREDDYIGPAERRGPHNMKVLTEATGGGVFTARDEEDLPRIVRTIGLSVRYRYVLSYEPIRESLSRDNRKDVPGDHRSHKIHLELCPKGKFVGYSTPYYKRSYHSVE